MNDCDKEIDISKVDNLDKIYVKDIGDNKFFKKFLKRSSLIENNLHKNHFKIENNIQRNSMNINTSDILGKRSSFLESNPFLKEQKNLNDSEFYSITHESLNQLKNLNKISNINDLNFSLKKILDQMKTRIICINEMN